MIEIKSTKYTIAEKMVFCFHTLTLQNDITQSYFYMYYIQILCTWWFNIKAPLKSIDLKILDSADNKSLVLLRLSQYSLAFF